MKSRMRQPIIPLLKIYGWMATLPFRLRRNSISKPKHVSHSMWIDFLSSRYNLEGMRVLEIGSRNVTGANLRSRFDKAQYVGFDFYHGENVDVVGDVHKLSSYFDEGGQFDLVFSSAVFEHLHMPWVAAEEIQRVLKVGGEVFVETHFSFSSHERPWNFFQFSDMGLRALFCEALGFELIDSGLSNPIAAYFAHNSDRDLRYSVVTELYCHSSILCRKMRNIENIEWRSVDIDAIVDGSRYPTPK